MIEEKPCPFCNSRSLTPHDNSIRDRNIKRDFYIECDDCGARTKSFDNKMDAWIAWDTRAYKTMDSSEIKSAMLFFESRFQALRMSVSDNISSLDAMDNYFNRLKKEIAALKAKEGV